MDDNQSNEEHTRFHTSTIITLAYLGRALERYSQLFLSREQIFNAFQIRSNVEKRPELIRLGPSEFCKYYELTNSYIDVFGNIFPYVGVLQNLGNVYSGDFTNIVNQGYDTLSFSSLVNKIGCVNNLSGSCGSCENSIFCFGTRAFSYLNGNIKDSDPFCWLY